MPKIVLIEPGTETNEGVMRVLASIGTNKADWKFPPMDLMSIGGALRKNGIEDFVIIDALNTGMTHEETKNEVIKAKPAIVVFTFTVFSAKNDMKVASYVKSISKNIFTMAVNFAAESYPGQILNDYPDLDFVAYHEPENPVLEIVNAGFDPKNVGGIYYRSDNGAIRKNPERQVLNLDEFGIFAHDKVPFEIYRSPYQKFSPMTATSFTRGCVNMCAHCVGSRYLSLIKGRDPKGGHLRVRSVKNCLEELRLIKKLGIRELRLFDGCVTSEPAWAAELFGAMASEKLEISFSCNVRADAVDEKILKKMKTAGCHLVSIGIDSTDQHILDDMKKNMRFEEISEAVRAIKKSGMRFTTYTTFGHKGETRQTMKRTIDYIKKIQPDLASFTIAVPIIGTDFYDFLVSNNYLDRSAPLEKYDPNLPPVYSYPDLASEEMYAIAMSGYRSFYLRPGYILKKLVDSNNLIDDLKSFKYFVRRYILEPLRIRKELKE